MHLRPSSGAPCKLTRFAIAWAIAVSSLTAGTSFAQSYTATDLGSLGGGAGTFGGSINASGQIAGYSAIAGNSTSHAFVYTPGASPAMVDICTLSGGICTAQGATFSWGEGINDSGQVAGYLNEDGVQQISHAFLYTPGASPPMRDLGFFGGDESIGSGINNAGQVTGGYCTDPSTCGRFWQAENNFTFLTAPTGSAASFVSPSLNGTGNGIAYALNGAGQATGWAPPPNDSAAENVYTWHAFLYSPGPPAITADLGTLPNGNWSVGFGINGTGLVTGASDAGAGNVAAFLYTPGASPAMSALAAPAGATLTSSKGYGINSAGVVVGTFIDDNGESHAFVSRGNMMTDLNSLIDPSTPLPANEILSAAEAINDSGWIVAVDGGHAYLLKPAPAPSCQRLGHYQVCPLKPTICSAGGFDFCLIPKECTTLGCENSLITWNLPAFYGIDPWLSETVLKILSGAVNQTNSEAGGLAVTLSTEPLDEPLADRTTSADLIENGALSLRSVQVIGPYLEITAAPAPSAADKTSAASKTSKFVELSVPYNPALSAPGTIPRMVKFDSAKGRWVDIEDQYASLSKHLVIAHVPAEGKFTAVAKKMQPGLPARVSFDGRAAINR
jgi:probable HAF family extracellular repeat protein